MGKTKYKKDVEEFLKKSPVVNFSSIDRIVKSKKNVKGYTKQLIRNLVKQDKMKPIVKGYYTSFDDPSLAVLCFDGYLGLQNALSHHEIWEQETIPIIVTPKKARQGIRKILGFNVQIRRISPKYFFGFEYMKDGDFYLPFSNVEKTFIDMIYFNQKIDKEVLKNFKKRINKKKLKNYLEKYPEKMKKRVLKQVE